MNPALDHIAISGIRRFNDAVAGIPDMVRLTLGEPDFNTPEHIKQAAIKAIDDDQSHYTANAGDPRLRAAVSKTWHDKYGVDYRSDDEILVTVGATEAIAIALQGLFAPGDAVLVPAPVYPGYIPLLTLNHIKPIIIDTRANDFSLTSEMIDQTIAAHPDDHIAGIILNYPNNPTGITYNAEQLKALAATCVAHDLMILADEIYAELTYGAPHVSIAKFAWDNTVIISGLSKSHAMTGWRIGFLLAPAAITQALKKIHQYTVTAATTVAQIAGIEALEHGQNDGADMRVIYQQRRDYLLKALQNIGFSAIDPQGAFYLFAKLPERFAADSEKFCTDLAKADRLAIIPGTAFGDVGQGYVRLSYAASEENLHQAVARLTHFVETH
ncbi:aminotransferase class I/II-fold pyridoxal phosphate-dependent enzyme [Lacticaseibacillus porcinae]|uniref:aminotransferase class I/II-fold pyridoxal phosphate-dependent enzyme n=1 Tax=Lacticaseibacillus porcinae TaxID=1123687 RepID=UPI000F7B731E|nr:aminotransferase class I/II-fold pyridoxal phosphate-dependent enzyme [Lacticaseibacillus porcinae]